MKTPPIKEGTTEIWIGPDKLICERDCEPVTDEKQQAAVAVIHKGELTNLRCIRCRGQITNAKEVIEKLKEGDSNV